MDGTHVSCIPPAHHAERYRNRHANLSHNVLVVVSFDMQFIYILSGVEGSAHDSRVLELAMLQQDNPFPIQPEGEQNYNDMTVNVLYCNFLVCCGNIILMFYFM